MALSAPQMAGDQLNPVDIEGHTLIVIPVEHLPHVPTIHTKKDEESPAIKVNVVDLSTEGGPTEYNGVLWFNVMLVNGLKRQIGATVLGRMVKGQAQTGKNAPWQLMDLLSNPAESAWVQFAEGFLAGPVGAEWERRGQQEASGVTLSAPAPSAPPAGPPATYAPPAVPSAPPAPAGPPAQSGPPTAYAAPPAPSAPAATGPAAQPGPPAGNDLAAQLSGLPPEELAKMMAAIQNQGQAAH